MAAPKINNRPMMSLYGRSFPAAPTSDHGKVVSGSAGGMGSSPVGMNVGLGMKMKSLPNTTGNPQFSSTPESHTEVANGLPKWTK